MTETLQELVRVYRKVHPKKQLLPIDIVKLLINVLHRYAVAPVVVVSLVWLLVDTSVPYVCSRTTYTLLMVMTHLGSYLFWNLVFYPLVAPLIGATPIERSARQLSGRATLVRQALTASLLKGVTVEPMLVYYLVHPLLHPPTCQGVRAVMTFGRSVAAMCCMLVANDAGFYFAHRLLHLPALYRYHKRHHRFTGTLSLAAEYSHPVENVLANIIPTFLPGILLGVHPVIHAVFVGWRLKTAYENHSGMLVVKPGSVLATLGLFNPDGVSFHDHHHSKNIGNFGVGTALLDFLCGSWVPHATAPS